MRQTLPRLRLPRRAVVLALSLGAALWIGAAASPTAGVARAADAAPSVAGDPKLARALKKQRILVIGATGRNGGAIVVALEAAGAKPRALVRDLAKAKEKAGPGVTRDWVVGDIRDPASLEAAMQGVDVVINAARAT
jgi:ABC-type glycerol-3-phosphate transport system substrate-binding protein